MLGERLNTQGFEARLVWLPLRAFTDPLWVPWVPTRPELIDMIFSLAEVGDKDVFYDLGSGDGRMVVEAAKRGVKRAVGIEKNRELYMKAVRLAEKEGVSVKAVFRNEDFFSVDISDATVVYMYLLTRINRLLAPKLASELRPGTRIVSLDFEIPGWRPVKVVEAVARGMDRRLYLYVKGVSEPPGIGVPGGLRLL
jgi:SAM-dependent methyltransferase